jgi:hypothetical protein
MDLQVQITELHEKVLLGDAKLQEKIQKKQERINELIQKKQTRLLSLELMTQLDPKTPEIVGCAYVVTLT